MSDPIPQFPLAAYRLQFKPVDTTNCIHVDSFASMEYSLQLDYAKLYHVPHAETLDRADLINVFCNGNKWIIALKHPEHAWRPSHSGGIVVTRNQQAAAAARLLEEERAVEEELTEVQPTMERFPSPNDEYEGPTPPPEIPPPTWEPPVPVHLELIYPPKPRNLGVDEHGAPITEPVPEDFLGAMMEESHHSFESAKNKVREAIADSNAALADVLKFQAKLKAQRKQCRDLMDAVRSIVGPEVARKVEEAVERATRDGVVEQWEDPDVFGQEEKDDDPVEEENQYHPAEEEDWSQPAPPLPSQTLTTAEPIPTQLLPATQPATQPAAPQPKPRTFLVPELPERIRNAMNNNNEDRGEGPSQPRPTSRTGSQSSESSTSSKRSREDDDQAAGAPKKKKKPEIPFIYTSFQEVILRVSDANNQEGQGDGPDGSSGEDTSGGAHGVLWSNYQVDDEADEADDDYQYNPQSSDSDSYSEDDSDSLLSSMEFEFDEDHAPLSPSGISDSDSDNDTPSYFSSSASTPRHPTGPRPPPVSPPPQPERRAKALKRNDNRLEVNPETGKLEVVHASDDPERGRRFREMPIEAESPDHILGSVMADNNKFDFEFDEDAWRSFEIPEETG
ncbi:hypothetical protein M413DRAFT_443109 [Hebeloma cylindrosporum]|uniref:Uncharacterized protein n=1 Tax=Hebeloma cylindrosporum TaxID=76867 RepID=A0A0C3CIQ9_HEBCY|nr:hypothetical protein M413DRAFT_443109 [Hebeloma cylindrosporum h7]